MSNQWRISLTVVSEDQDVIARGAEHLARAMTGMALDGTTAMLFIGPDEEEEEE